MAEITKTDEQWQEQLSAEQYQVTRQKGTERPFTGKYHDCKEAGMYKCMCCGKELFASENKFDSGTGWPSFTTAAAPDSVKTVADNSHGVVREEVVCVACDAHLGHVFPDGPAPSGLRFCINSASLDLESEKKA